MRNGNHISLQYKTVSVDLRKQTKKKKKSDIGAHKWDGLNKMVVTIVVIMGRSDWKSGKSW